MSKITELVITVNTMMQKMVKALVPGKRRDNTLRFT